MKTKNVKEVLATVNSLIEELEDLTKRAKLANNHGYIDYDRNRFYRHGYCFPQYRFKIDAVYEECNIFDWWANTLSLTQLKQMKKFLETAQRLGFTGYACFRVGLSGCSHGMWAHKEESTNGYSPDGDVLFHSFRNGDNYWDGKINGVWLHEKYPREDHDVRFKLAHIKNELRASNDIHGNKEATA